MTPGHSTTFRLRAEARLKNARLVELRERTGLTQAAFAAKIGIQHSTYCGYETMRLYPTPEHAGLLADLVGCEVDELFPEALRRVAAERLPRTAVSVAEIEPERLLTAAPRETLALPPQTAETPEDLYIHAEAAAAIGASLDGLSPRVRDTIIRHYGLHGGPPETLEAIAERYGVSAGRMWQEVRNGLQKLRTMLVCAGMAVPAALAAPTKVMKKQVNRKYLRHLARQEAKHACPPDGFRPLYRFDGALVPRPASVPTAGVFEGIFCSLCGKEIRQICKLASAGPVDFGALARLGLPRAKNMFARIQPYANAGPSDFYDPDRFEAAFHRRLKEAQSAP